MFQVKSNGLHIACALCPLESLHSQVAVWPYLWDIEKGAELHEVSHGIRELKFLYRSPIDEVHRHGIPVRIELAKIDLKDHHPIVADLPELGLPSLSFGVGLHYGEVVYDNVGGAYRLDFTVRGVAVNRTARFESLTK
ncbi:adenylate/guanylate cyclase domain-containing protein [Thalassospira lucentensis]|uniref:Guanylate cyclase domain-containing protein n=1 Tax=Thalassospira lucentensis TaxID=168935 RepID=A0A358HP04_9PROT|nr:adenylate/guanylate cyclase domain-containing protein [Thalassospira lucentensis]HBU96906.1 hypothetical protein [Thalassospira lucentensis]HCW66105.1 hypothetical protein [Thalassospira lucentensis]